MKWTISMLILLGLCFLLLLWSSKWIFLRGRKDVDVLTIPAVLPVKVLTDINACSRAKTLALFDQQLSTDCFQQRVDISPVNEQDRPLFFDSSASYSYVNDNLTYPLTVDTFGSQHSSHLPASLSPCRHTSFHMYWRSDHPFGRKQMLPVISYLATQNLQETSFNIWTDSSPGSSVNPLERNEFLRPILDLPKEQALVRVLVYNSSAEACGTVLEHSSHVTATDEMAYVDGDIFRWLVLHNYGGVYMDADTVLLRDMTPLLNQEFLYRWACAEPNNHPSKRINGAIMHLFAQSPYARAGLEEVARTPLCAHPMCYGRFCYEKLWTYGFRPTIFPSFFFDHDWCVKEYPTLSSWFQGGVDAYESFFLDQGARDSAVGNMVDLDRSSTPVLLSNFYSSGFSTRRPRVRAIKGEFAYHWHNQWKSTIESGSDAEYLETLFYIVAKRRLNVQFHRPWTQ